MDIVNVSEHTSKLVWDWMKITDKIPHAKASETGLTSFLMYSLSKSDDYGNAPAKLFTFKDTKLPERITGADFYLLLQSKTVTYKYLTQAKRMYSYPTGDIIKNI